MHFLCVCVCVLAVTLNCTCSLGVEGRSNLGRGRLSSFYFPSVNPEMLEGKKNIQSLTSRSSPCQNDLGVGGGGVLSAAEDHAVSSPLSLAVFLLCILVHTYDHFLFFLFHIFILVLSFFVFVFNFPPLVLMCTSVLSSSGL